MERPRLSARSRIETLAALGLLGLNLVPNLGWLLLSCYSGASRYTWFGFPLAVIGYSEGTLGWSLLGPLAVIPNLLAYPFEYLVTIYVIRLLVPQRKRDP